MGRLLLGFGVFLIGGMIFLLVRNGVFKPVAFAVEDQPAFTVLYKEHMGAYHKIMDDLTAVENYAKEKGIVCAETFGEYIDDPGVVEQERLRSNVGCVVADGTAEQDGFKTKTFPARKALVATFEGSPALGPYKVYGKAGDEMQTRRLSPDGAIVEVYKVLENGGLRTRYLFPVK